MSRSIQLVCIAALLAGASWVIAALLDLRLSSGDIYPPYSSLRADPLGTKGLLDSLNELPGLTVDRQFRHPRHLPEGRRQGLWVIGLPAYELNGPPDEVNALERFVKSGGRLVIALSPGHFNSASDSVNAAGTNETVRARRAKLQDKDTSDLIELRSRWGFETGHLKEDAAKVMAEGRSAVCDPDRLRSPPLTWHSAGFFVHGSNEWRSVAHVGANAVIIERSLGAGTIVLASDSYALSNEALRRSRSTEFLSWLVSDARRIHFNETHLGIHENPGVMTLARRFRLEPFLWALLALVGLFVWQGAASFVAPLPSQESRRIRVQGRDSLAGLVCLLRRNVAPANLLRHCVREWTRSGCGDRAVSRERIQTVEHIVARHAQTDPKGLHVASVYREITEVLSPASAVPTASVSSNPNPHT